MAYQFPWPHRLRVVGNLITMNFQDVDISVLAKFISDITGKNFVIDEGVQGKVSVISPTKVTPIRPTRSSSRYSRSRASPP